MVDVQNSIALNKSFLQNSGVSECEYSTELVIVSFNLMSKFR